MKKIITLMLTIGLLFTIAVPSLASDVVKEVVKEQVKNQLKTTLKNALTGQKNNAKGQNAKKSFLGSSSGSSKRGAGQKVLTVGFEAEFAPYSFVTENGTFDGFDLACAKELCRRLGWEYKEMPIDWNAKDNELKAGTINCIWSGFTINGRENDYEWSVPYVENKMVIVVKSNSSYRKLTDLKGKKLAALDGSSVIKAIDAKPTFKKSLKKFVVVVNYEDGFNYLTKGAVDAFAVDIGAANNFIKKNKGKFIIMPETLATEKYAIAFLKGNTTLRNTVNAEFQKMAYDGTIKKIAAKYVKNGLILDSICIGKSGRR